MFFGKRSTNLFPNRKSLLTATGVADTQNTQTSFTLLITAIAENTTAMDGGGIDVWKGSDGDFVDAVICTVDLLKKDSEIKILIGCNEEEKRLALKTHNDSEFMKGILIRRMV